MLVVIGGICNEIKHGLYLQASIKAKAPSNPASFFSLSEKKTMTMILWVEMMSLGRLCKESPQNRPRTGASRRLSSRDDNWT